MLRVGVIGLGMGRAHVAGFKSHPEARVVAVADKNEKHLKLVADEHEIRGRYVDPLAMLAKERLDVVSIATPNIFHAPLTLAALKSGCHVLTEKPLAMNAREARQMVTAAKKARKRLMVNFSYRFTDQSYALKSQVQKGVLGDIYFARSIWHRRRGLPGFGGWFGQKKLSGGGPLIDLGVHRLDLALWMMDYPKPKWVMGSTYNHIGADIARSQKKIFDVEDIAIAMIKFENGATLELEASWAANIGEKEMMETRLYGTRGGLVQRNINEEYKFEAEIHVENSDAHYDMKLHHCTAAVPTSYYHFIDCIVNNRPHLADSSEGLIVMEILDVIYKSALIGRPVEFRTVK